MHASYQNKIVDTFAREGFPIVAQACAELSDNLSYASVPADEIRRMTREVAAARPDAIIAWCTNFMAAPLAAEFEAETGIPFYDSTALAYGIRCACWATTPTLRPRRGVACSGHNCARHCIEFTSEAHDAAARQSPVPA